MRQTVFWPRAAFALGLLVASSALFAACGGGGGEATDEGYAKAICESNDELEEILTAALAAAFNDEEQPETDEVVSAFKNWLDALEDANPPDDVQPYHDSIVEGVRNAIDALESGDADFETAFDEIDAPEDPPQAIQDRISAAAENVPECEGIDIF